MKYRYDSTKGRYLLAEFDGQVQSLPTASAALEGTVYQYVGATDSNYTSGYFYRCESDGAATPTYSWVQTDVQPQTAGDYIEKVTTMPTASADELGNEYQYMGADDSTNGLIHAHFYECVSDGESTPTYSWHDLGYKKVFQGTLDEWNALTPAEQAQYDYLASPDENGYTDGYSTTETKTNKVWIDGKPIYRKVVEKNVSLNGNSWNNTGIDVSEIDTLCNCVMLSSKFAFGGFYTQKVSNKLNVYCVSDANWGVATFVLEYTKTTD